MTSREVLPFVDEASWLQARTQDVTATDAAAMCGVSAWKTRYQLWHEKHRGMIVERDENEAMRLGKRLEGSIAGHIALEYGFDIEPMKEYRRDPSLRLGSSFDYVLRDRSALLEIKLVGPFQFARGWKEEEGFGLQAPVEIEAQCQQEMLLAEIPVLFIGVLVGTETYVLRRDLDNAVASRLEREARAFWQAPEPEPDFLADADFIAQLYAQAKPGKVIDADERMLSLMAAYKAHGAAEIEAEKAKKACKAELLTLIGDAEKVIGDGYSLSAKVIGEKEIAAYTRKGYRDFRIHERGSK